VQTFDDCYSAASYYKNILFPEDFPSTYTNYCDAESGVL
jgi:hypothetical protein